MVTNLSFSESAYDRFVTKELKYDFLRHLTFVIPIPKVSPLRRETEAPRLSVRINLAYVRKITIQRIGRILNVFCSLHTTLNI